VQLKGGRYSIFKFAVYGDDIIHNTTHGALTPFTGVGTNVLTFPGTAASTNVSTWNRFDYSVQHKNVGGFAEGQATPDSPFYLRIQTNRKTSEGIRPLGAAQTSPGGPSVELPVPIDWTTTDVSGEMGYSSRKMHLAVSYLYSKFENDKEFLSWRNPFVTTGPSTEMSTIAADNKLERLALNGVLRGLWLDSTLAIRGVRTKVSSDFPIAPTFLSISGTTGANRLANASRSNFEGEVLNESVSAAFNSHIAKGWDSKVYYNWYKRENESGEVVFTPGGPGSGGNCDLSPTGASLTTCTTEFLRFEKKNAGLEVYHRVNADNRFAVGYDYLDTERERVDFNRSKEQKGWLEWKSRSLEFADLRVKYQHMNRTSEFLLASPTPSFDSLVYRFDAAPVDRDTLKITLDANPAPLLDVGGEIIYKVNRYGETQLGRTKDERQELNLSASYGDMKVFRVSAFADVEYTQYDSSHWTGAITSYPNAVPNNIYPWQSKVKDRNWLLGVAGQGYVSERLRLYGSYIWTKANGEVDFAAPSYAFAQPIDQYDNFRKQTLNVKGIYAATKQVDVTLGAAYEKYTYSDIQMNDYIYNVRTGTNQGFLSGAYAFPNYRASIVYATVSYRF